MARLNAPRGADGRLLESWTDQELDRLKEVLLVCPVAIGKGFRGSYAYLGPHFPNKSIRHGLEKLRKSHRRFSRPIDAHVCVDISDSDLAYIAGLLEGEGWIRIGKCKNGCDVCEMALVSNTDRAIVDYVLSVAPLSHMNKGHGNKKYPKAKPVFVAIIHSRAHIVAMCRKLIPFMRGAKKAKAQEVLERFGQQRSI